MSYVTAEQLGFGKRVRVFNNDPQDLRQGVLKAIAAFGLELKFGNEGRRLYPEIVKIEDPYALEAISQAIKEENCLEEIQRISKLSSEIITRN